VTKTYLDQGAYFPPGPMANELIAAGGGHAVTVASPAELRQAAPQVYLSEAGYGATPASLRSSPATKHLPAVEHNRVHTIPTWWVTTDGPSMAAAVANLAAVLHPGASAGQ
jgi:ABC-type Fe3+-hydroxamate transport system substrate-binding protein